MKAVLRAHAGVFFFFILATAVLCAGLFQGKVLIDLTGDEIKCYFSAVMYAHRWMKEGIFPLWNTLSLCGHPFGVHAVSSYNLLNAAALFFDPATAYTIVKAVGIFLNGYFFYWFLRQRGIGTYGAMVAGWIWMVPIREAEVGFFFLPLLFLLAGLYAGRPGKKWFTCLTVSLALYFLNANPHSALTNTLFLGAYLFWLAISSGKRDRATFLKMALPFALAVGLTAFYTARAFELYGLSNRAARGEVVTFLPTHTILMLFPKLFSSPVGPATDFVVPRILQSIFSSIPLLHAVEIFTWPLYLGAAAVIAFFLAPRTLAWQKFFFYGALGSFAYLMLHPFFYLTLIRHIPVLQGLVGVQRLFLIGEFSMLVVLAAALDRWLIPSDENRRALVSLGRRLAIIFAVGAVVLAALRLGIEAFRPRLASMIGERLKAVTNPSIFLGDLETFREERVRQFFDFFNQVLSWKNPHILWPLAVILVTVGLVYAYQRGWLGRRVFQAAFLAWTILDVSLVFGFSRQASAPAEIFKGSEVAAVLKRDPSLFRVLMVEDPKTPYSRMFLVPEANLTHGVSTADGYEYLYLNRYIRFYEWLTLRPEGMGPYIHPLHHFNKDMADFMNIKYFLTSEFNEALDGDPAYRRFWQGGGYKIYENSAALDRAFLVHGASFFSHEDELKRSIGRDPSELKRQVFLAGSKENNISPDPVGPRLRGETVRITRYDPHRVEMEAQLREDGYLVMTDNHYPGWRAEVDGAPAELLRADYTFRAVRLSRGAHKVSFFYEPDSLKKGLWISAAALVLAVILFFWKDLWRDPIKGRT